MSYNPKTDALLALAISFETGDTSEAIEAVQTAEQNRARKSLMLPKIMTPNQETFEALGFTFKDVGDNVLFKATLPTGWTLKAECGYWTDIFDEKGRKRGNSFYKGAFYDRNGQMSLSTRFHIESSPADKKHWMGPFTIFVQDADGSVVFSAGKCRYFETDEYYQLIDEAKQYLHENYPDWENPTKYWD